MLSLIIPFYNRKELFQRLFDSLNAIVEVEAELLFVDNGSEAATREAVEEFVREFNAAHQLMKARVITELKPGSTAARNKGLMAACGDYVYFFDSDDEMSPTMLFEAYDLAQRTQAEVVGLRTAMVMPNGKLRKRNLVRSNSPVYQIVGNNFATQSLFLNREFALKHGLWDERLYYWNDLEWGLRIMLARPRIAWLGGVYHKVYKHTRSITGESFSSSTDKILLVHSVMATRIDEADISQKMKNHLHRTLNCRKALYAGHVYCEGAHEDAKRIFDSIDRAVASPIHNFKLKILYQLSKSGIPGVWRLAI